MRKFITLSALGLLESSRAALTMDTTLKHGSDGHHLKADREYTKRAERLTVHLAHHTHDDVGWLKTVDEYYSGVNNDIQRVEVKLILDEVIPELIKDSNKRFSYVEMKFFSMWWRNQDEALKTQVRQLVSEGRLELLNAGWSMHDEACPHFDDYINNMWVGHDFVLKEFGVQPRIGWQIDPFGHSNANARLFAEMGFDAFFFARLDYEDKEARLADKQMEWVWRPMWETLGESAQIFTHALYHHYSAPPGFDFDTLSDDQPFIVDQNLETYNAPERTADLYDFIVHQDEHYLGNNMLITMGDDFRFQNAHQYFSSSDNMINYWNANMLEATNIELIYSTPSHYISARAAENITWPTKYDDMFPYADNELSFWTGYFTSRANDKKYMRDASHTLHSSNKLFALAAIDQTTTAQEIAYMDAAKFAMLDVVGVVQHHDSITGTAKQHVANNYAKRISQGMAAANSVYASVIDKVAQTTGLDSAQWQLCARQNGTYLDCPIADYAESQSYSMIVATHNPSTLFMNNNEIKVPHGHYTVQQWEDDAWISVPASVICNEQEKEYDPSATVTQCRMFVDQITKPGQISFTKLTFDGSVNLETPQSSTQSITHDTFTLTFNQIKDSIAYFSLYDSNTMHTNPIGISLRFWQSSQDDGQPSGAYIFRPKNDLYDSQIYSNPVSVETWQANTKGQFVVTFKHGVFRSNNEGDAVVTIQLDQFGVIKTEVELFGIPLNPDIGFEVTVNFHAPHINNEGKFYTDSNGLEMQERILNYRPTWNLTLADGGSNITANYYPIQTAIAIRDETTGMQMTVMNDRSQGGSVIERGRIELMQNRRINEDDWRGVDQALNETNGKYGMNVPATYFVHLFNSSRESSLQRTMQQRQDAPPQQFFAFNLNQAAVTADQVSNLAKDGLNMLYYQTGIVQDKMKCELFFEDRNEIILRIENIADTFDEANQQLYWQAVLIKQLADGLFKLMNGKNVAFTSEITEMSITANMPYSDMAATKIQWHTVDDGTVTRDLTNQPEDTPNIKYFQQQRIRVFHVVYNSMTADAFLQ